MNIESIGEVVIAVLRVGLVASIVVFVVMYVRATLIILAEISKTGYEDYIKDHED